MTRAAVHAAHVGSFATDLKLRIAFIGARGVVGTYSGIETYYEELGSRLVERGHSVTAYCRSYFTPDLETYRGIHIRRLGAVRSKHLETLSHSLLSTFDVLLRRYDIVQYHAIGSAFLAVIPRLTGKRTLVSVRGLDWQRPKWGTLARAVLRFGEWAAARCPTDTVVVSETLKQHYADVHHQDVHCIPNAVVTGERRELSSELREKGLEKDNYIFFAGRISPEKGVDTLLEALRPLPRTKKLVLAGGTSYTDGYIEKVKSAAWDDVVFLGRVDRETMERLYSNCYAFVLPSAMEGLSVALLEAMSYGNCIITTAIPENREVVGDAGLLFPSGDVEGLREVFRRVLEDEQLVQRCRSKAAERASGQPNWDDVARRTEQLYQQIIERPRTRGFRLGSELGGRPG